MHSVSVASRTAALLLLSAGLWAQQSSAPPPSSPAPTAAPSSTTIRGCLRGQRASYILIEDKTGTVYVLKGVGNKLDNYRRHEVEVKGQMLSGTVKTSVRPEKAGSNPADTVHSVDGVPFQVENVSTDVRIVSKQCKAADQQ
jgi:hypothetical protein